MKRFSCAGPFYDLPFSFVIKTDASGNNVQEEKNGVPNPELHSWRYGSKCLL